MCVRVSICSQSQSTLTAAGSAKSLLKTENVTEAAKKAFSSPDAAKLTEADKANTGRVRNNVLLYESSVCGLDDARTRLTPERPARVMEHENTFKCLLNKQAGVASAVVF